MDIIQIGANRGNDDLTAIIYAYKTSIGKLILVEPLSIHHDKLKDCYKGIPFVIEGVAITDDPKIREMLLFFSQKDAPYFEVASFSLKHLFNHGFKKEDIFEKKIECMTLNDLMNKHHLKNLDLLFIDAEGFDERIIRSIDFKNYDIEEIIYENIHIPDNDKLIHFLKSRNYHTTINWGKNGWSNKAVKQPFAIKHLIVLPLLRLNITLKDKMNSLKIYSKEFLRRLGLFDLFKSLKNKYLSKNKT